MSMAFEEESDCVDVEAVAQALAKAFDGAVVVAIAKTVALVVGDNCVEGSGANAIASAEGVAKRLAQAFAFAIAKASNQNASKAAPHTGLAGDEVNCDPFVQSICGPQNSGAICLWPA